MQMQKSTSGAVLLTPKNLSEQQNKLIDFMFEHDAGLAIAPTGIGKTVTSMTAAAELLRDSVIKKVLIVAPAKVVKHWLSEPTKWEQLNHVKVAGGTGEKDLLLAVNKPAEFIVTSFESLPKLLQMEHGCDAIIIDEMTRLRASGGVTYKALIRRIKQFKWRMGLSASPLAEDWQGLFGMMKMLDDGQRLGRVKETFLRKYFYQADFKGYKFEPKPDTEEKLTKLIADMVFVVDESVKRQTVKETSEIKHEIKLPDSILSLTRDMVKRNYIREAGESVTAANAAVAVNKIRQLAQGFIYSDDEEKVILWDGRFDYCAQLAEDLDRCVIVYEYSLAGDELQERLPYADRIDGKTSKIMFDKIMDKWRSGKGRKLLLQAKAGSHGLDGLQHSAHKILFFAPIWSNDATLQVIGRLDRTGQKHPVEIHTVVAQGVDEDVILRVEDKKKVFRTFMEKLTSY